MHWFVHSRRRKIWLVVRAEGIYGGNPRRVMDAGNGTKECSGRRPARFAGKRRGKVTGNFSTTGPAIRRICANSCTPLPPGATSQGNQNGLKTLKTAFFALFGPFCRPFFPTPGQHCACRFLPVLGVPVWNFCPNIGFIIPSVEAQKFFKKSGSCCQLRYKYCNFSIRATLFQLCQLSCLPPVLKTAILP
jgi:hypothetical protein